MSIWMLSANSNIYDHAASFAARGYIDWHQNRNFEVGDVVYIYNGKPLKRISFKTIVEKINMAADEITDDKEFWYNTEEYINDSSYNRFVRLRLLEKIDREELSLDNLMKNGLSSAPQGGIHVPKELSDYIDSVLGDYYIDITFPESSMPHGAYEGAKMQILVNKYERSAIARQKCIEYHGCKCMVCGFDFEKVYGEIGRDFIHVHHIVPLNKIGESYKVDYKTDLVPVCPNCHAMLHRRQNKECYSIEELKTIIRK